MAFKLEKIKTFELEYEGEIIHIYTPNKEVFDNMNDLLDVLREAEDAKQFQIFRVYEFLANALSINKENIVISADYFIDFKPESVMSLFNEYLGFVTEITKN